MEPAKNVKTHGNNGGRTDGQESINKRQLVLNQHVSMSTRLTRTMHARAGHAELIPWLLVPDCASHFFSSEARCCDVGGLLPYMIRIACSLSSIFMAALSGAAVTACAAGAADSSTAVGVFSPSLLWSSASVSIPCASGSLSVASASASGA